MQIFKEFTFEAAHFLPSAKAGTPNARIHGHSFRARVTLEGQPETKTGVIVNLETLNTALKGVQEKLDHRFLNEDIAGLEFPTLEHISMWIWTELAGQFNGLYEVSVMRDSCHEGCIYRGSHHQS